MKFLLTTFLLIISSGLFSKESTKNRTIEDADFDGFFFNEKNIPTVNVKVANLTEEEAQQTIIEYRFILPFEFCRRYIEKKSYLNPDGTLLLELPYALPYLQIQIKIGDYYYGEVFVNSNLQIELDAKKLRNSPVRIYGRGVEYLGDDGVLNIYLSNNLIYKKEQKKEIQKQIIKLSNGYDEGIQTELNHLFEKLKQIDARYIKKYPSQYSHLIKNERRSEYYRKCCISHRSPRAPTIDSILFEEIKSHTPTTVSNNSSQYYVALAGYLNQKANFFNRINPEFCKDDVGLTNEEQADINEFNKIKALKEQEQPYDKKRFFQLSVNIIKALKDSTQLSSYRRTLEYIDNEIPKNGKADVLKLAIPCNVPDEKIMIYETVSNSLSQEWSSAIWNDKFKDDINNDAIINSIANNNITGDDKNIGMNLCNTPTGAELYIVNNMSAEQLLANLRYKFADKALVLDFWATWCAPCLGSMRENNTLPSELKAEPIEFVYLCTSKGSNISIWTKTVTELNIGGTHLFVPEDTEKELMKLFSFIAFPSYAFIDKQGEYKGIPHLNSEYIIGLIKKNNASP